MAATTLCSHSGKLKIVQLYHGHGRKELFNTLTILQSFSVFLKKESLPLFIDFKEGKTQTGSESQNEFGFLRLLEFWKNEWIYLIQWIYLISFIPFFQQLYPFFLRLTPWYQLVIEVELKIWFQFYDGCFQWSTLLFFVEIASSVPIPFPFLDHKWQLGFMNIGYPNIWPYFWSLCGNFNSQMSLHMLKIILVKYICLFDTWK